MLSTLLVILVILYTVIVVALTLGGYFSRYRKDPAYRPTVSIVVAAKDEQENIGICLESLARLTYPCELLQIIIVDDHSADRTPAIVESYAERHPHIRLVHAGAPEAHLRGKAAAVSHGLKHATGEIVLFTDADCAVPPGWVESTVRYYVSKEIGLVAGFTWLDGPGVLPCVQALDWFGLFTAAAGALRLGTPLTAVGTNISVRREAYDAIGGFAGIPFSVTEDYALFHAVTTGAGYKAIFPLDAETLVRSGPCTTWAQLHRQKKRWFLGGKGMEPLPLLLFLPLYLLHVMIPIGFFAGAAPASLAALLVKTIADVGMLLPSLGAFRKWSLLPCALAFEIYYFLYVLIYPPLVLIRGTVHWKGRSYDPQAGGRASG